MNMLTNLTTICKGCGHDKYKHNRILESDDSSDFLFEDVCGGYRYGHVMCGCWLFIPKWQFWNMKKLWIRNAK